MQMSLMSMGKPTKATRFQYMNPLWRRLKLKVKNKRQKPSVTGRVPKLAESF